MLFDVSTLTIPFQVEHILRKLAGGMTPEEIIIDHPHLKPKDIYAAQDFEADYLADEITAYA